VWDLVVDVIRIEEGDEQIDVEQRDSVCRNALASRRERR
jgi:hypothetical protein